MNHLVNKLIYRLSVLLINDFRIEKHLRSKEPFRTNRNRVRYFGNWINSLNNPIIFLLESLVFHPVIKIIELFEQISILNNIAIFFFNNSGNFIDFLDRAFLIPISNHISNKGCHITSSQRNMFYTATNDKTINYWDNMCDTIT